MKLLLISLFLTLNISNSYAQNFVHSKNSGQTKFYYEEAFLQIEKMLNGKEKLSFKKAVFFTENAYFEDELDSNKFNQAISEKINIAKLWMGNNHLINYLHKDSINFKKNGAIFTLMTDTIFLAKNIPLNYPYTYDFVDFFGAKNWTKMGSH